MKITNYLLYLLICFLTCSAFMSCSNDVQNELLEQETLQGGKDDNDVDGDDNEEDDDDDDDDDDNEEDDDDDDDDDTILKHPTLYFVKLDTAITADEVKDLLDDLNSEEVWFREEINLRLWNTLSFPIAGTTGGQTTNIDGQIARARTRARVSSASFNVGGTLGNPLTSEQSFCFENSLDLSPTGSNEIKISILDTGIDGNTLSEFSGHDYIDNDDTPNDLNGHGTQIAGLINFLVNQNGISDNIDFDIRKTHDADGLGFVSTIIPAILDAVNEGADILNFSFSYLDVNGDTTDSPLRLAIDYAEQNGALILAAAGNTGTNNDNNSIISFPASYPNANIISNAAVNCQQNLSGFSSFGQNSVDLAFLGENIPVTGLNGSSGNQSGTSFSTAIITAMAAIMATHQQEMDLNQIKCALISTSDFSQSLNGFIASQGIVNFQAALANMESCR